MEKDRIINFFKNTVPLKHWLYLFTLIILFIIIIIIFNKGRNGLDREAPPSIGAGYTFDLSSDKNRLDCIFEQRRCLFNNIGLPKEETLLNCYGISYCEDKYGKK